MRLFRGLALTVAALVVSSPGVSHADGKGIGRGHSFREPSRSISTFPMSPRRDRRFDRSPFAAMAVVPWYPYGGTAVIPWDPYESAPDAVVPEGPAGIAAPVIVAPPPEPPVPAPKFVFPPTPSAPEGTSTHTVIVQRGSKIEIQSFPSTR
jgi:hypothetical protein